MMFRGAKFCEHCGCEAKLVEVGAETESRCPRCACRLIEVIIGAFAMEQCPSCAGLWMPVQSFDALVESAENRAAATGLMVARGSGAAQEQVWYPKCLFCEEPMSRVNYARSSGVLINICRAHGVWLDTNELHEIMQFIRSGGLDRARAKELEKLKQERRRVEDAQARLRDQRIESRMERGPFASMLGPLWWW